MHRTGQLSILGVGIFSILTLAPASRAQNQQVTVSVFSDVQVPPSVLETAQETASRIFSQASIEISWTNCMHAPGVDLDPACSRTYRPGDLVLRITSHVSHVSGSALGIAFLDDHGSGRDADIFWTRALELHRGFNADLGKILGCAMAHEMGHLLLGANSHSWSGLMQARWGSDQLQDISVGALVFLPSEGKKMRASISRARVAVAPPRINRLNLQP